MFSGGHALGVRICGLNSRERSGRCEGGEKKVRVSVCIELGGWEVGVGM